MELGLLHTLSAMWTHLVTASYIKFTCVWTLLVLTSLSALCSPMANVDPALNSQLFDF